MTSSGTLLAIPFGPELLGAGMLAILVLPFYALGKVLSLVDDAGSDDAGDGDATGD